MKNKILPTVRVLLLVILPFLIALPIGNKYSPYVEGNSFQNYIVICTVISMAVVASFWLVYKNAHQSIVTMGAGGTPLFLLLCPLFSIYGLGSGPDLSLKMLEYPEREHLRYILLFIALILFGCFVFLLYKNNTLKLTNTTKWLLGVILFVAFEEYVWEFIHHYFYPEALKEWVRNRNHIEEFDKSYDNSNVVNLGVIGRYFQFATVIWLTARLYQLKYIKIWCPIINIVVSLLGITSATFVLISKFNFPKGLEFLMILFIPGIPFFLLYWLGVALLTNSKKSEPA